MSTKKSAIVLDFDGTIADAEEAMIKIYKSVAAKYSWPELTHKDYYRLRRGNAREVMRWAGVKIWQLPRLLKIGRSEYKKHQHEIKLFKDMPRLIEVLSTQADVYILSSNDQKTVREILNNNKIESQITILRGSSIFGKDKALKKLLRTRRYNAESSWMIGDEVRDIEAGRKAGMKTIGVTWGLQSPEGLAAAKPDFIAGKPSDIQGFISKINI